MLVRDTDCGMVVIGDAQLVYNRYERNKHIKNHQSQRMGSDVWRCMILSLDSEKEWSIRRAEHKALGQWVSNILHIGFLRIFWLVNFLFVRIIAIVQSRLFYHAA